VSVQPPTIEAPLSLTGPKEDFAPSTGMEKLKYGRASLRSELMDQVLSGVALQMDRIAEEEREAARGIDPAKGDLGHGHASSKGGSGKGLNRAQRDASIDEWLQRRRGHAQNPGSFGTQGMTPGMAAAAGLAPSASYSTLQGRSERVDPAKRLARKQRGSVPNSAPSAMPTQHNRSAPSLFATAGGREIFDHVTKLTQDRASSRAFAAETLPKLPGLPEAAGGGDAFGASGGLRLSEAEYGDDLLTAPRQEIEDITRRLELLEQERRQIQHLKSMAIQSANLGGGQARPDAGPAPMPGAGGRGLPPPPGGLRESSSHGSMPTLGPLAGVGRMPRSSSNVSLQPIAGRHARA